MGDEKNYDFSGFATKYNVKCSDGRTILPNAFKHNDGVRIPLVWQHLHQDPTNILGHVILEHRDDVGMYVYGYFNDSEPAKQAKILLSHKDIQSMSIYANQLVEKTNLVHKGNIREVSLVLSGANPGAQIEYISFAHGDGETIESEDEAIISMLEQIELYHDENIVDKKEEKKEEKEEKKEEKEEKELSHKDNEEKTVADVLATLNEEQKTVVYTLITKAIEESSDSELEQNDKSKGETFIMKKNVFDQDTEDTGASLTHAQLEEFSNKVFADVKNGSTFKEAFVAHAGTYGIDNISYLFPDARMDEDPTFYTRRMGWVAGWMSGTRHSPFSRLKKVWADLTPAAARAKGYITGDQKVDQVFALLKRTTSPTTIYKKNKLDRDDIVDIVDLNVVNWMWQEMRFMLDEEVARAALVGDGRSFGVDDDAIDPSKIRPIYGDDPLFVHYLSLESTVTDYLDIVDAIQVARVNYKGTGTPNFYTTNTVLTGMLLLRDTTDRRIYKSIAELAAELRVADVIEVEVMEGVERTVAGPGGFTADLLGIMVNPRDYTYGADKGGQIATFENFDIDYNQQKYLIETRVSGSLLNPKSALVVERKQAA